MKVYDMHIHSNVNDVNSELLIEKLEKSGVYGGSVFSAPPEGNFANGMPYEKRVNAVLKFTEKYSERLYPFLWMDPFEKDAKEKAKDAASRGIIAFKIICDHYYVYEKESLELISTISACGKPIAFHSGILWDGGESSKYNKPIHWEAMLEIPNLKFSLAHCSWPWYDECIAVYGKFQNAYGKKPDLSCEMFFDLTPGTPVPYRYDLLYKIFNVGYDVKNNIMFGTDNNVGTYNENWTKKWINIDNEIYEKLKIDEEIKKNIYEENYLRFIGVNKKEIRLAPLNSDGSL